MRTGFNAYCMYIYIKNMHFKDNNYNAMSIKDIPLQDRLIDRWNNKRKDKDGLHFLEVENRINKKNDLALLFSSYHLHNSDFYIRDILEDKYNIFKTNVFNLKNVEQKFTNDLKNVIIYCKEDGIKFTELLSSDSSIPQIFKLDLSWNSLVILNKLFKINVTKDINCLEERRWSDTLTKLNKYELVIHSTIKKYDWKKITKCLINENK